MLVALSAWRAAGIGGALRFSSFEAFPLETKTIAAALERFPETEALRKPFLDLLAGDDSALPDLDLEIIVGDARQTVPSWTGHADAWFLDGFAPAKNPELWEGALLNAVARNTAKGGTAATYTAAGFVRRNLEAAGFEVERTDGFGRKRHMTRAKLP